MVSIRDLARYTGFSIATISRVLNNDPTMCVSERARTTILEAAQTLNYVPNRAHRTKKPRPTHIAVAEMLTPAEQLWDHYYLFLRDFALQACLDMDVNVSLLFERDNAYRALKTAPPDGVLAIGIFSPAQIKELSAVSANLVFLDSSPDELRFDSVVLNFKLGVEQALDYLIDCGHRRIGFLGPVEKLDSLKQPAPEIRRQVFIDYMTRAGLYDQRLLIDTKLTSADTVDAMARLGKCLKNSDDPPTAFLAYNEATAYAAYDTCRRLGLRVPQDLSIISFDNTPANLFTHLPLTSINTQMAYMGETAVRLLLDRIESPMDPPRKIIVPPTLVKRDSVISFPESTKRRLEPAVSSV